MTGPIVGSSAVLGLGAERSQLESREVRKAAQEFVALLLRHVLSALEKTTAVGGSERTGGGAYRSMVVDALSDGLAQAGGLGLSDLVARILEGDLGSHGR
jgi:Rod binding domain-containing protein